MRFPTRAGLTAFSGVTGVISAIIAFGSGATLALDGQGRYALLAQLAFVSAILALVGGVALVIAAVLLWRKRPISRRLVRWLAGVQLLLIAIAFVVGVYARLRVGFYLLLLLGELSTLWLWWSFKEA